MSWFSRHKNTVLGTAVTVVLALVLLRPLAPFVWIPGASARVSDSASPATPDYDVLSFDWHMTPGSPVFICIAYSESREELLIRFREPRETYLFFGVPASLWDDFLHADAPDRYYETHIKGIYDFKETQ